MNETPEQWADRIIETLFCDGVHVSDDTGLRLDPNIRDAMFTELAAVKRKADAYEELRQCFRGDPRMDGSTAYMVPDMVRANAVLNRHDVARIRAGLQ